MPAKSKLDVVWADDCSSRGLVINFETVRSGATILPQRHFELVRSGKRMDAGRKRSHNSLSILVIDQKLGKAANVTAPASKGIDGVLKYPLGARPPVVGIQIAHEY